ncbi:unnamed protein product, partial [Polarella glacialis]
MVPRARSSQSVNLLSQDTRKTHGKLASFRSFPGSRARTTACCGSRQGDSCSAGGKLPQGGLVLQRLLDLGRTPSEDEVSRALGAELDSWKENP